MLSDRNFQKVFKKWEGRTNETSVQTDDKGLPEVDQNEKSNDIQNATSIRK